MSTEAQTTQCITRGREVARSLFYMDKQATQGRQEMDPRDWRMHAITKSPYFKPGVGAAAGLAAGLAGSQMTGMGGAGSTVMGLGLGAAGGWLGHRFQQGAFNPLMRNGFSWGGLGAALFGDKYKKQNKTHQFQQAQVADMKKNPGKYRGSRDAAARES